jgi:hypothetical protein
MTRYFLATNDVESTSIRYNKQRSATAEAVLKQGMPLLLEVYRHLDIRATFFFTGEIAEQYPELVRMVVSDGHEVACHGYSHEDEFAFDRMGYHSQLEHLTKAKAILENISASAVVSFRAPALRVNEFTPRALEAAGFLIDSSISPQRADSFLSFGALKKINRLFAPRLPYHTAINSLAAKGNSPIFEIPISALLVPYIGTFMRLAPGATKTLRSVLHRETMLNGKPVNFLIHPNECILEDDSDAMARRSSNPLKYLLAEKLRTALKQKNLGSNALLLYKDQLEYFNARGYVFCTLQQYRNEYLNLKEDKHATKTA